MVRDLRRTGLGSASMSLALGISSAMADTPAVVASIKPIHAIVANVMQGVGAPVLLVRGTASPHTYSLRPSDARALDDADVVFWVGDRMETFLEKPLSALSSQAEVVVLGSLEDLTLLPMREGGVWATHEHEHDAERGADAQHEDEEHGHEHEDQVEAHEHGAHEEADMHIWLDTANAEVMTDAIVDALSRTDPDNAATYARNAEALKADLRQLDERLARKLAPVADRPFVVFHDAYHYFEHRSGLDGVGSITVSPERPPGAQRLQEIRDDLAKREAACVFAEPQFEPALVETVVEGTGARTGVLDPEGAALDEGPRHYFELMDGLADTLVECLSAG
jgi:zinc transport system substrate-binding protein